MTPAHVVSSSDSAAAGTRCGHLDYFGAPLGDLPRSAHRDEMRVLACLAANPVFSVFDVSTAALGRTLERLRRAGRLHYPAQPPYPWARVEVRPAPTPCLACERRGFHRIAGRHATPCGACAGHGWIPHGTAARLSEALRPDE